MINDLKKRIQEYKYAVFYVTVQNIKLCNEKPKSASLTLNLVFNLLFSDPKTLIDISISKTLLTQFEDFFISELEPLEMSDILLEENFLSLTEHDNIESESSLKRRNEILLSCLKGKPNHLHLFAYALTQSKRKYILEKIKNSSKYEDSKSGKKLNISIILGMYFSSKVQPVHEDSLIIEGLNFQTL